MTKSIKRITAVLLAVLMAFSTGIFAFAENSAADTDCYYNQGDYSIHYTVVPAENDAKGRIMFIHGFLYSGSTWNGIADIMSKNGYDCYLVDLPNYGYSTRENAETKLIDREELVVGLMESIAPMDSWILAGHSMGGGVALNIACDHPEIQSLMLFCPSEIYMQGNKFLTSLATNSFVSKMMDSVFKLVLGSKFIVKAAVYMAGGDMDYAKSYDADLLAKPLLIKGTGSGMLYSSANARNTSLEDISKITVPTLLVWADGDNVISDSIKTNITSALPSAQVETVKGKHIVIETNPEELAELSLSFLNK